MPPLRPNMHVLSAGWLTHFLAFLYAAGCGGASHWKLEAENYEGWRVKVSSWGRGTRWSRAATLSGAGRKRSYLPPRLLQAHACPVGLVKSMHWRLHSPGPPAVSSVLTAHALALPQVLEGDGKEGWLLLRPSLHDPGDQPLG